MGNWILSKIRYFFWSTLASSALMIGSAFSPSLRSNLVSVMSQMQQTINEKTINEKTLETLVEKIHDFQSPSGSHEKSELSERKDEAGAHVSSSTNEYEIDNRRYVLIEGNYYPARKDNIYLVNGRKIFYVNNRAEGSEANAKNLRQAQNKIPNEDSDTLEMPTSPSDMLKILNRAQKQMKDRSKALDEIEKQDTPQ